MILDVPRIVLKAWRTASEIASYITILYYNILEYCGEFRVTESRCQCSAMETVPTRVPTHRGGGLARWTERGAWRSLGPGAAM